MPTFQHLPSGSWRVQVRKAGLYRAATFPTKREAKDWAATIEGQANHIKAGGFAPIPKSATVADLLDKYIEGFTKAPGKTKSLTLEMLKRELGKIKLASLNAVVLRDFIDRRTKAGAGGVTIAGDLSTLSQVLKWARHSRQIDVNDRLATDARASLVHRGINTRSMERDREPTDEELTTLYEYWQNNAWLKIPMVTLCKFALATGMRQSEITGLMIQDIDRDRHTVIVRDRKDPKNKQGNDQTVPLLPEAWALVEPLIQDRSKGKLFPYKSDSVSANFTRATTKLKINDLHFHDLRHKATADFFRMGLDIPRVALLTGHKTWEMLKRYTSIKPEDVLAAINKPASPAPDKAGQKDDDREA